MASFRKKKGRQAAKTPEAHAKTEPLGLTEEERRELEEMELHVTAETERIMAPLRALAEREGKTWEALLEGWELLRTDGEKPRRLEWLALTVFGFLRQGLGLLREALEKDPARWEDPGLGIDYAVPAGFVADYILEDNLTPERLAEGLKNTPDLVALLLLTKRSAYRKKGEDNSPLLRPELEKALEPLTPEAREVFLEELSAPYTIGGDWVRLPSSARLAGPWGWEGASELLFVFDALRPDITFQGEVNGKPFSGSVVALFHPLVVDEAAEGPAWPEGQASSYRVEVGLFFDPLTAEIRGSADTGKVESMGFEVPSPADWSPEERAGFWEGLFRDLDKTLAELHNGEPLEEPKAETSATGTFAALETKPAPQVTHAEPMEMQAEMPAGAVVRTPPAAIRRTFPVAFGRARMDAEVQEVLRHLHRVRLPARKWSTLKPWHTLKDEWRDRILEEEGERAFEDLRATMGDKDARGPLLKRRHASTGEAVVELTAQAVKDLKVREGTGIGFRFLDEKTGEEFLTRLFQVGGGFLEVGLSWGKLAGPWVEEWRKELEKELEKRAGQASLFDTLDEGERERVERSLRYAQSLEDGRRIMEAALGQVSVQGQNPVHIPALGLKTVLRLERDRDWKARVEGGLNALRAISFRVDSFGASGQPKAYGHFLSTWHYDKAGPGAHGVGDYWLRVNPDFLTVFRIFESGKRKLPARLHSLAEKPGETPEATAYDFRKRLTAGDKKGMGWGSERKKDGTFERREPVAAWAGFDAGRVFYNAAEGLTGPQGNLVGFLERELTLRVDTVSKHLGNYARRRPAKAKPDDADANEPRIYSHEECPLLPAGQRFHGALGHFKRWPENGRTLAGTPRREGAKGGAHAAGLLHELGYSLPSGGADAERSRITRQALEDLKAVVTDYLGGVVAASVKGKGWMGLAVAANLPERELLERASFYLFLPETWHEDRKLRFEKQTGYRPTEDPAEAERARVALRHASGEDPENGLAVLELRHVFRARRLHLGLSTAQAGTLFGVSKMTVSRWERGPDFGGKPIPEALAPSIRRWADGGEPPTPEELAGRKARPEGRAGL